MGQKGARTSPCWVPGPRLPLDGLAGPAGAEAGGGGCGAAEGRGPQQAWRCPEPLTAKGKRQEVRVHKTSNACRLLGPRSPPRLSPPNPRRPSLSGGGAPRESARRLWAPRAAGRSLASPGRHAAVPLVCSFLFRCGLWAGTGGHAGPGRSHSRSRQPPPRAGSAAPGLGDSGTRSSSSFSPAPGQRRCLPRVSTPCPAAASGPRAWSGAGPPSAFSPHRRQAGVRSRPARSACRSLARASLPSFVTDAVLSVFCTLCISAVSDAPGCVGDVPGGQVVPRKFCDAIYLCFPMSRAGHTGSDFPSPDTRSAVGGRRHLAAPCARMRLGVRTVAVGGWPPPAPLRRQRPRRPRRLFSRAWAFGGSRGDGAPLCCGKRGFLVSGCFLGDCPPQ